MHVVVHVLEIIVLLVLIGAGALLLQHGKDKRNA